MGSMERFLTRLAGWQFRRAFTFTFAAWLVALGALPLVLDLGLNSSFEALLPRDKPSVRDLEELQGRIGGLSSLSVAILSPNKDVEGMQGLAKDLVPRLEALDSHGVRSVDWNVAPYEVFVREHRHLYADLEDLREARDTLDARLSWEKGKRNPFYVALEDEPEDPGELLERLRNKSEAGEKKLDKYPGGYYVHADRDLLALFLRTDIGGGDAPAIHALQAAVEKEIQALDPSSYGKDLRIEFGGSLMVAGEEHDAIAREMVMAVVLTMAGVLLAIFIFFRKVRAILVLGSALAIPVLVTFGFAELAVDYLNTSTVFLGSIVIGNGINPNIVWLARYFEERRGGRNPEQSIRNAHLGVWTGTLTASTAAAIAYASLIVTDFRGFRDFGIIGGVGMILCWIGAIVVLPAFVAVTERIAPLRFSPQSSTGTPYGRLFSRVALGFPKPIVALSVLLGLGAFGLTTMAVINDPLEYDFRKLKSIREKSSAAQLLNGRISDIVGSSSSGNAIAVVVDDLRDVDPLRNELEKRIATGDAPYKAVRTIDNLLPEEQKKKIPILQEVRSSLLELRRFADEEQRKDIDGNLPPESPTPLTAADLPEAVARPFTERDGTRGRILFVERRNGVSIWDGRYLVEWARDLRTLRLPDGSRPPLAGRAPVFADMIAIIWEDGPKAIAASFAATLLLVVFAFRTGYQRWLTMLTLLLGILWMTGTMAALGMKLNFLNFVALPITFGNGIDYGVNVMRRYAAEKNAAGSTPIRTAIEETGGAVVLCALTTIIGYGSLYASANQALNSFGAAMAISEVTCVAAAVLTLPALLWIREAKGSPKAT
ncbi:MAG: MMPL family transporter [Myxococcales bacterium]|nr:MMPL family transporter [Myxococcales bacterium]